MSVVTSELSPSALRRMSFEFTSTGQQLELVKRWNVKNQWGFTLQDFRDLGSFSPRLGFFRTMVLEVTLASPQDTFEAAIGCIEDEFGAPVERDLIPPTRDPCLARGTHFTRGLRWVSVYLGPNEPEQQCCRFCDLNLSAMQRPAQAVLWAAAYMPQWLRAMDGVNVPYVLLPGYEVSGGSHIPVMYYRSQFDQVKFSAHAKNSHLGHWAVPTF